MTPKGLAIASPVRVGARWCVWSSLRPSPSAEKHQGASRGRPRRRAAAGHLWDSDDAAGDVVTVRDASLNAVVIVDDVRQKHGRSDVSASLARLGWTNGLWVPLGAQSEQESP